MAEHEWLNTPNNILYSNSSFKYMQQITCRVDLCQTEPHIDVSWLHNGKTEGARNYSCAAFLNKKASASSDGHTVTSVLFCVYSVKHGADADAIASKGKAAICLLTAFHQSPVPGLKHPADTQHNNNVIIYRRSNQLFLPGTYYVCLNPSPVSQHAQTRDTQGACADRASAIDAFARQETSAHQPTQKPEKSACYH